jgi:hypothetical protein
MAFKRGQKVMVALDAGENAGEVLTGTFVQYANSERYAYVDVMCPTADHYMHRRRVPAKNVATAAKVAPLKKYEQLFGKDD